jgi:hypothetical protein
LRKIILLAVASLFSFACASGGKHFDKVLPGMTMKQVRDEVSAGPSRFEVIENTPYTSWYWGDEMCVLFNGDKVVAKETAVEGNKVEIAGGSYESSTKAQCVAPGQSVKAGTERKINIPGVGTVHIPEGILGKLGSSENKGS